MTTSQDIKKAVLHLSRAVECLHHSGPDAADWADKAEEHIQSAIALLEASCVVCNGHGKVINKYHAGDMEPEGIVKCPRCLGKGKA